MRQIGIPVLNDIFFPKKKIAIEIIINKNVCLKYGLTKYFQTKKLCCIRKYEIIPEEKI